MGRTWRPRPPVACIGGVCAATPAHRFVPVPVDACARVPPSTVTCKQVLAEDGAKESEVVDELAILKAQLAFACLCVGRRAQAEELCREVVKSR